MSVTRKTRRAGIAAATLVGFGLFIAAAPSASASPAHTPVAVTSVSETGPLTYIRGVWAKIQNNSAEAVTVTVDPDTDDFFIDRYATSPEQVLQPGESTTASVPYSNEDNWINLKITKEDGSTTYMQLSNPLAGYTGSSKLVGT